MGLGVSVGDLLHPRGVPHPSTYELIGGVYHHLAACEPFLEGTESQAEVALIIDPATAEAEESARTSVSGAIRMLQQLRQQFDVVGMDADLTGYRLVVVPDGIRLDPAAATRLRHYGGSVLFAGDSDEFLAGLDIEQSGELPYTHTFLRPGPELRHATADYDTVVYQRGKALTAGAGANVLAGIVEPYFERTYAHFSGHSYTAPDRLGAHPALLQQGNVIVCALPLFETFGKFGNVPYREVIGGCIERLLPDPLVRAGGPAHVETGVAAGPGRTVLHLLSYLPARVGEIELVTDPFPLLEIPVQVRLDAAPREVRLQPDDVAVPFDYRDGYVRMAVTISEGHGMLVIER